MRKKSWKQVAAIVICAALLSGCTGENGQEKNTGRKEGQVVNIYCWNDEFKEIYDKYASDLAKKHDVEVNFVIISSDNNAYQINLDEALKEQNTCIDDDKVDLFLIEADYASKYVKSDNSIDVKKTVGLTDEDLKQQYDYTKKIVSENGIQKGVTWQATPGLFAYRRSIAKKVLGTDDPDQVQKQLKDWDKFDQVAQKMNAAGYKMLSGYDDSYRAFSNNVSHPWVVDNKIVIDENIKGTDTVFDFKDIEQSMSGKFEINPQNATQLLCDGTVYQVTSDTVSNNELGSHIGILAENVIFNAETKIPLSKEELRKIDWYGENAGQHREQWIYKDIYEIHGTEKTEAVAVQINDRYYIAKRQ